MGVRDLVSALVKAGPDNVKKLIAVADNLPSEDTLNRLMATVDKLIPYIPQLEKLASSVDLKSLQRSLERIPDSATLNRLSNVLPLLEKLPDESTLRELLTKAEGLSEFIKSLED